MCKATSTNPGGGNAIGMLCLANVGHVSNSGSHYHLDLGGSSITWTYNPRHTSHPPKPGLIQLSQAYWSLPFNDS